LPAPSFAGAGKIGWLFFIFEVIFFLVDQYRVFIEQAIYCSGTRSSTKAAP
jgi:hypothetical protein